MQDNYEISREPWEEDTYQTGPTRPRKSYGGIIALLLGILILLSGILTAMGLLNIKLFQALHTQQPQEPVLFSNMGTDTASIDPSLNTQPSPTSETDPVNMATSPASPENIPQAGGLSLQQIYESCIPSVVSISCVRQNGTSSGTGVVLTADGYLVTNCHVVEGAQKITVLFTDGRNLQAQLVGADEISDLAVLRVDASDLTPALLGDSSVLRVGDAVVAIGDPLGVELRGTMTDGIVSAINRDITVEGRVMSVIQTNAALNSGNSGGPLINCYGQVVGINTMKIGDYVNSAGVEGLGFAIPSTTVRDITNQLISQGFVSGRPTLGIAGEAVSSLYQFYYRLPAGMYVTAVEENSAAYEAGIRAGDILLKIDGTRISSYEDMKVVLYSFVPGDTVELLVYRGGNQYSISLTVDEATG